VQGFAAFDELEEIRVSSEKGHGHEHISLHLMILIFQNARFRRI
jgi:hypothetical protein